MANPHDIVALADDKAYVTRYGADPTAASPMARGDDVLIVDPRDGTIKGRIDLHPRRAGRGGATVFARPDRAIIAAGKVIVSLNSSDATFATYGEGRLAFIDPLTDQVVQTLALTGLKNCEALDYVPTNQTVLVGCGGAFGSARPEARVWHRGRRRVGAAGPCGARDLPVWCSRVR